MYGGVLCRILKKYPGFRLPFVRHGAVTLPPLLPPPGAPDFAVPWLLAYMELSFLFFFINPVTTREEEEEEEEERERQN